MYLGKRAHPASPLILCFVLDATDSDDFTAYCLILPMLGIGPQWWIDSHNIHHVVCNDVHCGELRSDWLSFLFLAPNGKGMYEGVGGRRRVCGSRSV